MTSSVKSNNKVPANKKKNQAFTHKENNYDNRHGIYIENLVTNSKIYITYDPER